MLSKHLNVREPGKYKDEVVPALNEKPLHEDIWSSSNTRCR
jgi:hypothetical protein